MNQIEATSIKLLHQQNNKLKAQRNLSATKFKGISPHATSAMSQNKHLKLKATFTIAEVALDIFLTGARKRRVTAKRSSLNITWLMTVLF